MKTHYVDMKGVIVVRNLYDELSGKHDPIEDTVDVFDLQEDPGLDYLPEDYCAKDRDYGVQRVFYCLSCDCELKSWLHLDSHASGAKHARKVVELKRLRQGLPAQEPPESKKAKVAKQKARPNRHRTLREKLEDSEIRELPILGLECITEFISPSHPDRPHFYSCSLKGCKSAWGDSNDMFHHLCSKSGKHSKNYITHVLKDAHGASMNKAEILARSVKEDIAQRNERNRRRYDIIKVVWDEEAYREISTRPDDWSEAKVSGGGGTSAGRKRSANSSLSSDNSSNNANLMPLGVKRSRREETSPPPADVNGNCEGWSSGSGSDDDDECDDWISGSPWIYSPSDKERAERYIEGAKELEEEIRNRLRAIEEERVSASRLANFVELTRDSTRQYTLGFSLIVRSSPDKQHIQAELDEMERGMGQLLEDVDRVTAKALFKADVSSHVADVVAQTMSETPEYEAVVNVGDGAAALSKYLADKIYAAEVRRQTESGRPWDTFHLAGAMMENVGKFVSSTMQTKYNHFAMNSTAGSF